MGIDKSFQAKSPALATLNRFKQVAVRPLGQFAVGSQRRIQIRQHLAYQRHPGIALSGITIQLLL